MMDVQYYKLEIFIPETHFRALQKALQETDAGHIGQYDCCMSLTEVTSCWRTLPGGKELLFYLLNGKTVDPESHAGTLTKVTEDEKFGMLTTESPLQPLQNLMLRIGGLEAYAKVTDCGADGFRIGFTMKPEGFSDLLS